MIDAADRAHGEPLAPILDLRLLRGVGWVAGLLLAAVGVASIAGAARLSVPWADRLSLLALAGVVLVLAAALARSRTMADADGLHIRDLVRTRDLGWDEIRAFCIERSERGPLSLLAVTHRGKVVKVVDQQTQWTGFSSKGDGSLDGYRDRLTEKLTSTTSPLEASAAAGSERVLPYIARPIARVLVAFGAATVVVVAVSVALHGFGGIAGLVVIGVALVGDLRRFPPGTSLLDADRGGIVWYDRAEHGVPWPMVDDVLAYGSGWSTVIVTTRDGDAYRVPSPRRVPAETVAAERLAAR